MSKRDPWTTIPLRQSTRKLLVKFMGALEQKTGESYTYDQIIRAILRYAPEVPFSIKEELNQTKE